MKSTTDTDNASLWQQLDVDSAASIHTIRKKFKNKVPLDPAVRFAYKALTDPYYRDLYTVWPTKSALIEGGFFDDGITTLDKNMWRSEQWLSTPLHKIIHNLDAGAGKLTTNKFAVLMTTGAFSPIHNGHLSIMENARTALEKKGFTVVGGYFIPGHDSYVSVKKNGTAALDASHRLQLCELAVKDSDWLMVDSWAARYAPAELNFTDIYNRMEKYLVLHCAQKVQLYYVFGGDNAGFARAFVRQGNAVCVARPGHEKMVDRISAEPEIMETDRILFTKNSIENDVSSTRIRTGEQIDTPSAVLDLYKDWQQSVKKQPKSIYAIRNDVGWAIRPWSNQLKDKVSDAHSYFISKLVDIFKNSLDSEVEILLSDLESQQEYVAHLTARNKSLNMDACTSGGIKINASRYFAVSDGQLKAAGLTARPGSPALSQQMATVPSGDYIFIDDDIATGNSLKEVKRLLSSECKIVATKTLLEYTVSTYLLKAGKRLPILDIVDGRDFLIGSKEGGLVVELPDGTTARAPYMLPYASLFNRARVPLTREYQTAILLWKLNAEWYQTFLPDLKLKDVDSSTRKLLQYVGFSDDDIMRNICQWHSNCLMGR